MLNKVKLALRISTNAFDTEISALIADCLSELTMLGIYDSRMQNDEQILSTVIFYCKARFGDNENSSKWDAAYNDKITKLIIAADYGARRWTEAR